MNDSKADIIIKNIIECSADAQISSAEIDLLIADLFSDIEIAHKSISDIKSSVLQKYEILEKALADICSPYDIAKICVSISNFIATHKNISFETDYLLLSKQKSISIAYWNSNSYAREAALAFSELFETYTEIHSESFTAVCESISSDDVLGVIPMINSTDGRLMAFYRLLDKYDLKINATHNVENPNGDGFTKFALVGKQLHNLKNDKYTNIEFSFNGDIVTFIYAASLVGCRIKEVTSIPSHYSENEPLNYITASVKKYDIYCWWWFLYLFGGEIELIGIYTEI